MILEQETVVALVTEMDLATVMALGQAQVLEKVMGMVTGTETALEMATVSGSGSVRSGGGGMLGGGQPYMGGVSYQLPGFTGVQYQPKDYTV